MGNWALYFDIKQWLLSIVCVLICKSAEHEHFHFQIFFNNWLMSHLLKLLVYKYMIHSQMVLRKSYNLQRIGQGWVKLIYVYHNSDQSSTSFKTIGLVYAHSWGEIRNLLYPIKINLVTVFGWLDLNFCNCFWSI